MEYDQIAYIVKFSGTIFFFSILMLVFVYTFWPKNKGKFEEAASRPLQDETLHPSKKELSL